jgi:transcriptional regulator with XRE-family HTH domain
VAEQSGRRCAACGSVLSRYNGSPLCGACSRSPQLPAAGELWATSQVLDALAGWDVGTVVALYRRHTGVKQARIAAAVGIDQSEVSRLERGSKKIRDRQQLLAWTRALGVPERFVPTHPVAPWAVSAEAGFVASRSEVVISSWLSAEASPTVAEAGGLRVTGDDLDVARGALGMFRQLDHAHGAGGFAGHLATYIDTELTSLRARPSAGKQVAATRDRLAAEFLELAGYQAVDTGCAGTSQDLYQQALSAAIRSGDVAYGGYLVAVNLGHLALHCGHPDIALMWAQKARAGLGSAASPATRAAVTAVSARALARMGREAEATVELMTCERLLERSIPDDEPEWIRYFDRAYLSDEIAHCLHDLGRPTSARSQAEVALNGVSASRVRRLGIDATLLASAWLQTGEVEQACAVAREAAGYTARTSSGRCRARLAVLLIDLSAYRSSPCVADLTQFVREVLPEVAADGVTR